MKTDWFEFWSQLTPDKIAIVDTSKGQSKSYSYRAINNHGKALASWMRKHSICKGDRVAVLAEFCAEYIFFFAAALKLGFILVPLNYRLTSSEIKKMIDDVRPSLMFAQKKFGDKLTGDYRLIESMDWDVLCNSQAPAGSEILIEDDPLFILYTSGSSGVPKGVLYTYKMLVWNSLNTSISLGLNSQSSTVVCMPPFHTGGWNVLLTPLLHMGGCCVLTPKYEPQLILNLLEEYRCTVFMAVPTMLKMMLQGDELDQTDLSSIEYFIVGGEAMPIDLIKVFHGKGICIRQGYGMTEAGPNLTSLHQSEAIRKTGSIGKPNMYVQIKIVDEEGVEIKDQQPGELLLKGPIVTPGYYNQPDASREGINDGWLHTGDVVVQDEEGYLFIVDRIKNMYISGGENVYPSEVERILREHLSIEDVVIFGVADEKWGETGMAVVVPDMESKLTLEEIQSYCRGKIAKYKIPQHLVVLPELPQSDTGKIDRKALKRTYCGQEG